MKNRKNIFIFIICIAISSISLNAQWKLLNIKTNYGCINSVYFSDSLNGWGTADKLLKTTDGGLTWNEREVSGYFSNAYIFAADKNTIWVTSEYMNPLKTTDGGETWNCCMNDKSIVLIKLSWVNSITGMAIGWKKADDTRTIIYKTTDGGINWEELFHCPAQNTATCINCTSEKTAYFTGRDYLYKTGDGGKNWEKIEIDSLFYFGFFTSCFPSDSIGIYSGYVTTKSSPDYYVPATIMTSDGGRSWKYNELYFSTVSIFDNKYGYACSYDGKIAKTTDCGNTWQIQNETASVAYYALAVFSPNNAIVFGDGGGKRYETRLKTYDGGKNWQLLDSGRFYKFNTMRFINKQIGYGAGNNGEIFKTTNGGNTWNAQSSGNNTGNICSGYFLDSLNGWYLLQSSTSSETTILRTANGGSSWDSLFTIPYRIYSAHFHNKNTGFVCGTGGRVFKTTNGGKTWKLILTKFTYYDFVKITFSDEKHGWITANQWEIFRTTDGGDTWFSCRNGWGRYNDLVFIDSLIGWSTGICGSSDVPFTRTTDGGASWIDYSMVLPTQMSGLSFPSRKTGYSIGGKGVVCKTTDSGDTWRQLKFPSSYNINEVCFVDDMIGWVATENGLIYYTENGGEESQSVISDNKNKQPKDFQLYQNYPNPFNPSTLIKYSIPKEGKVTLTVYNLLGQKMKELVNEFKPAGNYELKFNAAKLPAAVYFYQLQSGNYIETKKLILLK